MMAMITKMAKNAPNTISNFFWPFCGSGSSTGCMRPSLAPFVRNTAPGGPPQRAASSSTVRLRPARQPTTICGTISPDMSARGTPQPPLL